MEEIDAKIKHLSQLKETLNNHLNFNCTHHSLGEQEEEE